MKPFRAKAKELITRAIKQRLFLIETGKSRNFITWQQCKQLFEELEPLKSDYQFALFTLKHGDLLLHMVPGNNTTNKVPMKQLIHEAKPFAVKAETPMPAQTKMEFFSD